MNTVIKELFSLSASLINKTPSAEQKSVNERLVEAAHNWCDFIEKNVQIPTTPISGADAFAMVQEVRDCLDNSSDIPEYDDYIITIAIICHVLAKSSPAGSTTIFYIALNRDLFYKFCGSVKLT